MPLQTDLKPAVRICVLLLTLTFIATSTEARAQPNDDVEPVTIMVTGRLPGPRLWKVSKGDHALYIFGYLSPLPKRMRWESQRVEEVLSEAQEFIGMLTLNSSFPLPKEILRNPDGKKLEGVLPAASWNKYLVFTNENYRRSSTIEKYRPAFAASVLTNAMYDKHDLTSGDKVLKQINKLARRNRTLKFTDPNLALPADLQARAAAAALANYLALTVEQEASCFESELDQVMRNINLTKQAANAWAEGEVGELGYLLDQRNTEPGNLASTTNPQDPCMFKLFDDGIQKEINAFTKRKIEHWLEAVGKALTDNETSFTILPVNALLDTGGLLKALRERGYHVQVPQ